MKEKSDNPIREGIAASIAKSLIFWGSCVHEWDILKKIDGEKKYTIVQRCKNCGKLQRKKA